MSPSELTLKVSNKIQNTERSAVTKSDLRKSIGYFRNNRDEYKCKYKEAEAEVARLQGIIKRLSVGLGESIRGHKYGKNMVDLCVTICAAGGCSFDGTEQVVKALKAMFGLGIGEVPCSSTIANWVLKCGLSELKRGAAEGDEAAQAVIVDECMGVGRQSLLLTLAVPAEKAGGEPLRMRDAKVVSVDVATSWDAKGIAEKLLGGEGKTGSKPLYCVSDGARSLVKAAGVAEVLRVCDCGHEAGRLTEQVYKEDARLKAFRTAAAQVKFKEVMTGNSHLTPPKQRTIARYMNMPAVVEWGIRALANYGRMTKAEQGALKGILVHKEIIEEMSGVLKCSNAILKELKSNGLSYASLETCQGMLKAHAQKATGKAATWADKIGGYLEGEKAKLPDEKTVWQCSSDIIESMFGVFKSRKASNPMYGVTLYVLMLCVLVKTDKDECIVHIDKKDALESVRIADLDKWRSDHLLESQAVKRRKTLKKQE